MPNQVDSSHTHSVVMWEEKTKNQAYAVVDLKRAKAVTALKIGISIVFEGYQRERRRGKILFLGSKTDCFTFGVDLAEDDEQVSFYSWSGPPGLREQTDEVTQAIRNVTSSTSSTFQRTTSSSSITSISSTNKPKRKKLVEKNTNVIDQSSAKTIDKAMPTASSSSTSMTSSITVVDSAVANTNVNQSTNSNNQSSTTIVNFSSTNIDEGTTKTSIDIESLLEENKALREKILALQDQLAYEKDNSIPLPSEEVYQSFKSICSLYEKLQREGNQKATEMGKLLPCSEIELKLAKKTLVASTINNLVKYCFKGLDLKNYSYQKLKSIDEKLLKNIYEYVCSIHAPQQITPGNFSSTISLKCRHLREGKKTKPGAPKATKSKSINKKKGFERNNTIGKENVPEKSHAEVVEDIDQYEDDDSNEMF